MSFVSMPTIALAKNGGDEGEGGGGVAELKSPLLNGLCIILNNGFLWIIFSYQQITILRKTIVNSKRFSLILENNKFLKD